MVALQFHLADYLVCLFVLLASLAIGVYYALTGGKQKSLREYVLGDQKMSIIPVATSMAVTYLSTLTLIGYPTELYMYGISFWIYLIGKNIGIAIVASLFVPLFYPLNMTSITEYLQMRYQSKILAKYGSALQIIAMLILNGATLYGPTAILEAVAGVAPWISLLVSGLVAAVCTTIGGYKGVIGTDLFQAIIMVAGITVVIIQCTINIGGIVPAWKLYGDTGRLHVDVVPSLFKRMDMFSMIFGFSVNMYMFGTTQAGFQRYCSVPTKKAAYGTALMAVPVTTIVVSLASVMGIVSFAYYQMQECHPFAAGYISNPNGIVPYLAMDILRLPGASGLFAAACLCGSLSNASSAINAAASLLWQDFIASYCKSMAESRKTTLVKVIAFGFGIISIAAGYLALLVGGTLMKIAISFSTVSQVPLGLLFLLGGLFPKLNWKNALVTSLLVYTFMMSMPISAAIYRIKSEPFPLTADNCTENNIPSNLSYNNGNVSFVPKPLLYANTTSVMVEETMSTNITSSEDPVIFKKKELSGIELFSTISHMWYAPLGNALGFLLCILLSFIPGFSLKEGVEDKLLFPFVRKLRRKYGKPHTRNTVELVDFNFIENKYSI